MKPRLTLKTMVLATLFCLIFTVMDNWLHQINGIRWFSPRDLKAILTWIVILIGWAVYFLDLFRNRRNQNENDEKSG